ELFNDTGDTQQPTESLPAQGDTQNPAVMDSNLVGEQPSTSREAKPAPPSFLARLNEAKAKKGEQARLFVAKTSEGSRLMAEKANTANNAPARSRGDTVMGGT